MTDPLKEKIAELHRLFERRWAAWQEAERLYDVALAAARYPDLTKPNLTPKNAAILALFEIADFLEDEHISIDEEIERLEELTQRKDATN